MMSMLRSLVESNVADALRENGGVANAEGIARLSAMEGIYFAKGTLASRENQLIGMKSEDLSDTIFEIAAKTYEAKEAFYG
jgi:hypothetical protein